MNHHDDPLLPDQAQVLSMSGLEFMQAMLDGRLSGPPIARLMNFRLHAVDPGRVTFRGSAQAGHMNPLSTVHGGWYGAILDSALACSVMTAVPRGSVYTTLEYKVNLTRTLHPGTEVEAIGEIAHAGRSTGVSTARLVGVEDGKLYATGSTTCLIMKLDT